MCLLFFVQIIWRFFKIFFSLFAAAWAAIHPSVISCKSKSNLIPLSIHLIILFDPIVMSSSLWILNTICLRSYFPLYTQKKKKMFSMIVFVLWEESTIEGIIILSFHVIHCFSCLEGDIFVQKRKMNWFFFLERILFPKWGVGMQNFSPQKQKFIDRKILSFHRQALEMMNFFSLPCFVINIALRIIISHKNLEYFFSNDGFLDTLFEKCCGKFS